MSLCKFATYYICISDNANMHILSVLIQTFEPQNRVVGYFYKAIKLGPDSSGKAQAMAIFDAFTNDGIYDFIHDNVVAIVTDG